MVAKTIASRKAKGRNLQKEVVTMLLKHFPHLSVDDVKSTSMGAGGEDVLLSKAARDVFPCSVECKATESFSLWAAWNQAVANARDYNPIVVHRKSRTKAVAIVDLEYFVAMHSACNRLALLVEKYKPESK